MQFDDPKLQSHEARLFPGTRISSGREAEQRATAAVLAVARSVSEFGRAIVSLAGGPKGRLSCYTEVPFRVDPRNAKSEVRPDGLLRVRRGKKEWTAFVEVKVGDNPLEQTQFDTYHKLAGDEYIDAVITISNEAARTNGLPPLTVDGRRLKRVSVTHLSWERLLSEARVLSRRKSVDDPDQQWILEEWIRYVSDPASKIIEPPQLGEHWTCVLRSAGNGSLGSVSHELSDVLRHWDAYTRKAALRLRSKLGVDVQPKLARAEKKNADRRLKRMHADALRTGELSAVFRVPDAVGDVCVCILLPSKKARYGVTVKASTEGWQKTRLNWILRQLKSVDAPQDLSVTVDWEGRSVSQARLCDALADPSALLRDARNEPIDKKAQPRKFILELSSTLPKGRGRSNAPVLEGISCGLEEFYRAVVEGLRPFVPTPPRLAVEDNAPDDSEDGEPASTQSASRNEDAMAPTVAAEVAPSIPSQHSIDQ